MMKNRPGEKIKLASLDELLGVVNEESAMEIEINKIHAFKNHPFKVLDDEKMQDLIESVKLSGVLTPVLLRVDSNDEYGNDLRSPKITCSKDGRTYNNSGYRKKVIG